MFEIALGSLLLFLPGIVLLNLPPFSLWFRFSQLEKIVFGSLLWSLLFVLCAYGISTVSTSLLIFFGIFLVASLSVLAIGTYALVRRISRLSFPGLENTLLIVIIGSVSFLVLSLVLSHGPFSEYDALFYYLPLAKSILLTGGLQTDVLHQTVLSTTIEPALPLMYAFAGFSAGGESQLDLASRLIPYIYVLLTSAVVYLTTNLITRRPLVSMSSAAIFLALPITSTINSTFSLYLDIPFTFFLATVTYVVLRIVRNPSGDSAWWFILGATLVSGLFERDILFFVLPSIIASLGILAIRVQGKKTAQILAVAFAVLFAGAYNLFFVIDAKTGMLSFGDLVARELPALAVMELFYFSTLLRGSSSIVLSKKNIIVAVVPLVAVVGLLSRNLTVSGAITSNLFVQNALVNQALGIISAAGRPSAPFLDVFRLFQWQTLLTSLQLGGLYLAPIIIGLASIIYLLMRKDVEGSTKVSLFILTSFFLAELLLWSWVFRASSQGPELRRLYYFAPLIAVFSGLGIMYTSDRLGLSMTGGRTAAFVGFTTGLFWYSQTSGSNWILAALIPKLDGLQEVTITDLVVSVAVFALAFWPYESKGQPGAPDKAHRRIVATKAIVVISVLLTSTFIALNSAGIFAAGGDTETNAPQNWENGLYPVIQYLNQYQINNYGIVATYGLPIAYFTPHPVVDSATYYGVTRLLVLNATPGNPLDNLLRGGIRYLLLPSVGNNFYNYSIRLGEEFVVLNRQFVEHSPGIVVLKNFPKYTLFEVVPSDNLTKQYSFLTTFSQGWGPIDSSSRVSYLEKGAVVSGGIARNVTLGGSDPDSFWSPAVGGPTNMVSVSDSQRTDRGGGVSLRISLNGTGGMVINHQYSGFQDWSAYSFASLNFFGANTSKSITLTFHTVEWKSYFALSFRDNFLGWKSLVFPLGKFVIYGTPNWGQINYVEVLMSDRNATYFVQDFEISGYRLGLLGNIPNVKAGASPQLVVSIDLTETTGGFPAFVSVVGNGLLLVAPISDGVNIVSVPAGAIANGATVEIYVPAATTDSSFTLLYFGVLTG